MHNPSGLHTQSIRASGKAVKRIAHCWAEGKALQEEKGRTIDFGRLRLREASWDVNHQRHQWWWLISQHQGGTSP